MSILSALEAENSLIQISPGVYRVPDKARTALDQDIAAAENVEKRAREFFLSLAENVCPDLDGLAVWDAFERHVLVPLVRDVGANTCRLLIAEDRIVADASHADSFIARFGEEHRPALKTLATSFLDPQQSDVRSFITRLLHAQFCVESSGVSGEVLEKLKAATGKPLRFRLFVDTNFLFSLLGLHENPSNAAARELKGLLATFTNNPRVQLYVTPRTITEAKSSIGAAKLQLSGIPRSANFTGTALRVGMSGMSERFFAERQKRPGGLTPKDWFDPYLEDFVPLARKAGVELFNENLDAYATRQDVIDDIHSIMKYEEALPEERRKSYEKVAHDVILWHLVKDRRPAYVESPADAQDWVLTVDFRFIGFDRHKLKATGSHVPLCLHPTALIQLLQFWVPRTREFEEAVVGGLRLPFLFREFDADAERLSLAIIRRLGRFEGSSDIPEDTLVQVVLNDGLRARVAAGQPEEEEIRLVRDALVDQMRLRAEQEKAKISELTADLAAKNAALAESAEEQKSKDTEIADLQRRLAAEEAKLKVADKAMESLNVKQSDLESQFAALRTEGQRRKAILSYLSVLVLLIVLSVGAGWFGVGISEQLSDLVGAATVGGVLGLCVFVLGHVLIEMVAGSNQHLIHLWPFRKAKRLRAWLLGFVLLGLFFGVAGNLIANRIQKHIDTTASQPVRPVSHDVSNP